MQGYERVLAPFDGTITAQKYRYRGVDRERVGKHGRGSCFMRRRWGKLLVYVAVPEVYADAIRDGTTVFRLRRMQIRVR